MAGRSCYNSITLGLILLANLDSVIDKCVKLVQCQPLVTRRLVLSLTPQTFCRNVFHLD